jgi:hypothetical protein
MVICHWWRWWHQITNPRPPPFCPGQDDKTTLHCHSAQQTNTQQSLEDWCGNVQWLRRIPLPSIFLYQNYGNIVCRQRYTVVILPVYQTTMRSLKSPHGWRTYAYVVVKGSKGGGVTQTVMKTCQTSTPHAVRFQKSYWRSCNFLSMSRSVSFSNPLLPCCLLKIMSRTSSAYANTVSDMTPVCTNSKSLASYGAVLSKADLLDLWCGAGNLGKIWYACGLHGDLYAEPRMNICSIITCTAVPLYLSIGNVQ